MRRDPRFRPYPRDARGVSVNPEDVPDAELEPLVRASYDLVRAKGRARKTRAG